MTSSATPGPFTVGWFTGWGVPDWSGPWAGDAAQTWVDGTFTVETVRDLERAGLDLVVMEDLNYLSDVVGGTFEQELRTTARAPKHDPVVLMSRLAAETERIGLIATASTTFWPPVELARTYATLDHLAGGRVGWNVVTSTGDRAAQNFGMDALPGHAARYATAAEYLEVVHALWRDGSVAHRGEHLEVTGRTGTRTPAAGRPLVCQAGASAAGTALAGRFADVVVSYPPGVEAMREFRSQVRAAAGAAGRDPDDVQVLYLVTPHLGETEELAAQAAARYYDPTDAAVRRRLVQMSGDVDFSAFDLDAPLPDDVTTEGSRSILDNLRRVAAGRTLREFIGSQRSEAVRLVGTATSVADQMEDVLAQVGGDGFLLFGGGGGVLTRRYVRELCDGLMPELRRRGLAGLSGADRPGATLRDRLRERRCEGVLR